MKVFISSTYTDLVEERRAVQQVLSPPEWSGIGMEFFPSAPTDALTTALGWLAQADAMVLLIGFKAGSLAPAAAGMTYTRAEFEEARKLKKPIFVFVRTRRERWRLLRFLSGRSRWKNDERDPALRKALDDLKRDASSMGTPAYWETTEELKLRVSEALHTWEDRGLPGARRTFAEWDEIYSPPPGTSTLFDYNQKLCGRKKHLDAFDSFLENDAALVGLLPGRGGIGKSKLLRDWTHKLCARQVLFLRDQAIWRAETLKEIPVAPTLIVADDCHRTAHLNDLLALVRELRDSGRKVKLVLSYRPSGTALVRAALSRRFEPSCSVEFPPVEALEAVEVRELAAEVLGPHHQQFVQWLADMSGDTPLVTVIGGRLVSRGGISAGQLASEAEFRRLVFDKYLEDYELSLPKDDFPYRELLYLLSALGPLVHRSEGLPDRVGKFVGAGQPVRGDQVLSAIDVLEQRGLVRVRGSVRVVPDVLSDYLLEQHCTDSHGHSTGYADALYAEFGSVYLSELLRNLSELDWRISRAGASSVLLAGIWASLTERFRVAGAGARRDLLKTFASVAFFHPQRTLEIVRVALESPVVEEQPYGRWSAVSQQDVERELPRVLRDVAYHAEYTEAVIRLLWNLASKDERPPNQYPEGATRVLEALVAYDRYLSPAFNLRAAEAVARLAQLPHAFKGKFTPLDLVDKLFELDGEFHETLGLTLTIGAFELNHEAIRPVRAMALNTLYDALDSTDPRAGVRAVASLTSLLHGAAPRFREGFTQRELAWQEAERLQVLERLDGMVRELPLPVNRQLLSGLRAFVGWSNDGPVKAKALQVLTNLPQSDELTILDAFFTTAAEWRQLAWRIAEARRRDYVDAAVKRFREVRANIPEQIASIESMYDLGVAVGFDLQGCRDFLLRLSSEESFAVAFSERLLHHAPQGMGYLISYPITALREQGSGQYIPIARRAAASPVEAITRGCAISLYYLGKVNPSMEDLAIVQTLCANPDQETRRLALGVLSSFDAQSPVLARAVEIALGTDIGDDKVLAHQLCDVFSVHAINPRVLTLEQSAALLLKLVPVPEVDNYSIEELLNHLVSTQPSDVFDFLMRRIETGARAFREERYDAVGVYHAVPSHSPWVTSPALATMPQRGDALARILEALTGNVLDTDTLGRLFWHIGGVDATTLAVLDERLRSGGVERVKVVVRVLRDAPKEVVFHEPQFAIHLVDICTGLDAELGKRAVKALALNAQPKYTIGAPGISPELSPFEDRVNALATEAAGNPTAVRLYEAIVRQARLIVRNATPPMEELLEADE